jgi:hypothetical protein
VRVDTICDSDVVGGHGNPEARPEGETEPSITYPFCSASAGFVGSSDSSLSALPRQVLVLVV